MSEAIKYFWYGFITGSIFTIIGLIIFAVVWLSKNSSYKFNEKDLKEE